MKTLEELEKQVKDVGMMTNGELLTTTLEAILATLETIHVCIDGLDERLARLEKK